MQSTHSVSASKSQSIRLFQLLGSIGLVNSKKRERIQLKTANSLMYTITNYLRGIIKDEHNYQKHTTC